MNATMANTPGFILPPEGEVDCECDWRLHRPVFLDPTGWNYRVTACVRCGTVTVTESLVEEPHPNDVHCVGNRIADVAQEAVAWLSNWPRLARGVWNEDRSIYLPAAFRCQTVAELETAERAQLAAQSPLAQAERLRRAGVPSTSPPPSLPAILKPFPETQAGLQLTDETDFETLVAMASRSTWASPFAQTILEHRPHIAEEIAALLRTPVPNSLYAETPVPLQAALDFVGSRKFAPPVVMTALVERLRTVPPRETRFMNALLDTFAYLGPLAAEARPILKELADRVGERHYYFHKRIVDVREMLRPPHTAPR
jgi:hypothetical protein